MNKYSIGIDVGGTHTDAVLVNNCGQIIARKKCLTTSPIEVGFKEGLCSLLSFCTPSEVEGVFVGTTHATNALLERKRLYKVGVIRIAGHRPDALPPCSGWPSDLQEVVFAGSMTINGGFECDGKAITLFSPQEARQAVRHLVNSGAESIAITGVFSPILSSQEEACAEEVRTLMGETFPLSLSSQIGGIGFIERENATVLNSALQRALDLGFKSFKVVTEAQGISAPLWMAQNDGSILPVEQALQFPILTLASGPTNSFVGASKLTQIDDAIVIDIGGTSSDIGKVSKGYAARSTQKVNVGGVMLNFKSPDLLALAIGGGTLVGDKASSYPLSKKSCGKELLSQAQIFGGETLTLTDVACIAQAKELPGGCLGRVNLDKRAALAIMDSVHSKLSEAIARMKGRESSLPVIVVGGGAFFMEGFSHPSSLLIPKDHDVANAYGAALAQVSATIDTVVSLEEREKTLDALKEKAEQKAVENGASVGAVALVDLTIIPYHYMPDQFARVIVKAAGRRG